MASDTLNLSLVQADLVWEDKSANLERLEAMISGIEQRREVVLLPEMFSTGFSMSPASLAEGMDGTTVQWMKAMAAKYRCILAGSIIIEEEGNYYNRLIWMQPDGQSGHYDKRHLFAFAGEDQHYSPGSRRFIASVKGWKICLNICYDLRFPVWARNQGGEYDVLVYVANWPAKRSLAWKALLQARAIENQCYVAGVNRVGTDGSGLSYKGESSVFDPLGELLTPQHDQPAVHTVTLSRQSLDDIRSSLPFLKDADRFMLL